MRTFLFFVALAPYLLIAQTSLNMTLLSTYDDPDQPLSTLGTKYSDCWGFTHANGTEVAIIGGTEDILFIDITNPGNPELIYSHHVLNVPTGSDNQSGWRDFMTYGNYIYAAADQGTSGLLIFDLSQVPTSITLVTQTTAFWTRTHTIFIDEPNGKLYAGGSNTVSSGLVILDLTADPENPTLAANVPLNGVGGGYVHDMYARDNIVYCSHGSLSKIQMYDFSQLPNFTIVGAIENYPEPGYNHSSWLSDDGTWLAMCDETHGSDVKLVDITDPLNISSDDCRTFYSELLGPSAPNASVAHNPFILGDLAFIAYYHDGVQIFDISDPEDIDVVAYYDTYPDNSDYNGYEGCWGVYPYFPSGLIVASDMTYGLFVLEITNPPLDIDFLSFNAYREKNNIELEWVVGEATHGNKFEVMKSTDGGNHFQSIGTVALHENESHYAFTDQQVAGSSRYTYRIDFIQDDLTRISSPMRFVRTLPSALNFRVVNPTSSSLIVDILNPVDELSLNLYNIEGLPVWSEKMKSPGSRIETALDGVPPGQYVLTLQAEGESENLIIQKIR